MFVRCVLSLLAILLWTPFLVAQSTPRQIIDEINSFPEKLQGEWKIGGQTFQSNEQTRINTAYPFKNGGLVAVQFVETDDGCILTGIASTPFNVADINDGPYVLWKDETTAEVVMVTKGKVDRETYQNITKPIEIADLASPESTIIINPQTPIPPASSFAAPSRLMAISDLEGNYQNALQFLIANGVVDEKGHWAWGDGHLMLVGDLIDRGNQVTELMWMIRRLERGAIEAEGRVHYLLGNHEAMVMAGDLRYIYPTYHFVSQKIGVPYDQLFGETSEIGRWWRSKNAVTTIGDLLFVHGGYSPLLDAAQLNMITLNERVRSGLAPAQPTGTTADTNPVAHQHGPFWYRGYFDRHAAQWGKATPEEVGKILKRHQAKHIVIGHTVVDHVGPLDDTGQVIGIDVKWNDPSKGEGLLMEGGKLWRVNMAGERTELELGK